MLRACWRAAKRIPGIEKVYLKYRYRKYLASLRTRRAVGNGVNILVINHHFDQDIEAMIRGCGDRCRLFVVDCMPFFNQAFLFFKTVEERDGVIPYPALEQSVVNGYRAVARQLFDDLRRIFPFEAVVMPSDSFWWLREFLVVAGECGIPRIVLDKEGTISPYSYEVHSRQIREKFPFISDHLLVWSVRQRDFWVKAGASPQCIKVVGQPRSDFFFRNERWLARKDLGLRDDRRVVLFFTFDIDAYINVFPAEEVQREQLSWLPLRDEVNSVLIEFARAHPDIDMVVKTHPQQSDVQMIRQTFAQTDLPNVKVMEGAYVSNHLIVNCDLIMGFQTTALMEAMLTNKPVVYTGWSDTEAKVREHLIPFHGCAGLQVARSKEDFARILRDWASGVSVGGDISARKSFTDYYLEADGNAGDRLAQALVDIVRRRANEATGTCARFVDAPPLRLS